MNNLNVSVKASQSISVLVDRYFEYSESALGDLIISVRPNKVYLSSEFISRWKRIGNNQLRELGLGQRLIAFLIINDLVFRKDLLELLLPEIANRCRTPNPLSDRITITLEEDSFINVILSKATLRLINDHKEELAYLKIDVDENLQRLNHWFWGEKQEEFVGTYALVARRFLQPLIFASVCGFLRYFSLPQHCFERLELTNQDESDEARDDELDDMVYQATEDSKRRPNTQSSPKAEWFSVYRLFELIRSYKKREKSEHDLLENIAGLKKFQDQESVQFLFIDWIDFMISVGSRHKSKLKPSTIEQYSRLVFECLFSGLSPQMRHEKFLGELCASNADLLFAVAESSRQQLKAALDIFRNYISTSYDSDLSFSHLPIRETRTVANIIWPAEISSAIALARNIADATLAIHCAVAIILAVKVRVRISELLNLLVGDLAVSQTEGMLLVTIRKSKSKAGQRTVRVPLKEVQTIVEFLDTRVSIDRADSKDSLWGSYSSSETYQIYQFKTSLNKLLKSATGDLISSFHSLSHTRATSDFWRVLGGASRPPEHPNQIFRVAADFGHLSYSTTWTRYTHCVEYLIHRGASAMFENIPADDLPSFTFRVWLANSNKNTFKSTLARSIRQGATASNVHQKIIYGDTCAAKYPPFDQSTIQFPSLEDLTPPPRSASSLRTIDVYEICTAASAERGVRKMDLANRFGIKPSDLDLVFDELGKFGEFESVAIHQGVVVFRSRFNLAFGHSFSATTLSLVRALNANAFNNKEDYLFVHGLVSKRHIELSMKQHSVTKLIDFLKFAGIQTDQCTLQVGVDVDSKDSEQMEGFFLHTFLSGIRMIHSSSHGKNAIRLHIFKKSIDACTQPQRNDTPSRRDRLITVPGNRSVIDRCVQAAFMCQLVIWEIERKLSWTLS